VAYRKFTRCNRKNKNPTAACAYHAIRKKFPLTKDESFSRFEIEEEDKIFE
jgi:hypothetical protein